MTPGRRAEDESLFWYASRLIKGEQVLLNIRIIAMFYALAFSIWGGSLIFFPDARAYENPVFNGIFTAAIPQVWGAAFWTVACFMIATAVTARAIMYLIAVSLASGFLAGWTIGVIMQWLITDAALTGGALALFIMAFTGLGSTVASKRTLEYRRDIYERTPDGVVVPLIEADRRTG